MSGPIIRTGTNPKFWANWDKAFGKSAASKSSKAVKTAEPEAAATAPAKKVAKKAAAKKAAKKK